MYPLNQNQKFFPKIIITLITKYLYNYIMLCENQKLAAKRQIHFYDSDAKLLRKTLTRNFLCTINFVYYTIPMIFTIAQ